MGWAYVVHTETGAGVTIPDDQSVLDAQAARGWVRQGLPAVLDPDAPNSAGDAVPVPAPEPLEEPPAKKGKRATPTQEEEVNNG